MEIRINKECLNFLKSKIVYAVIKSRHSNSTKYNVYVKYQTNSNSVDAIESWYCTCKAGMRTVGCCSHVASIIYFLSHGKYLEHIPNPNSKLTSIFPASNYKICLQKKKSVISKGKKSKLLNSNETNDSLSESEFSNNCFSESGLDNNDDIDDLNKSYKRLLSVDTDEQQAIKRPTRSQNKTSNDFLCKNDYSNDCFSESGLDNNNGIDDLNKSLKRLLSVDTDEQQAIKRPSRSQNKTSNALCLNIEDFKLRIPEWGGQIVNGKNIQIKNFKIVNTCKIDYFLLSLWACFRLNNKISNEILHLSFDKTQYLIDIINSIEFIQWNKAKSIWILMFLFDVYIQTWVFVQTNDSEIYVQEVPRILPIGLKNYKLLTATIHLNNHFRAVFYLNNEFFLIDDCNPTKINKKLPKLKVGTCFFYCMD